jgi:FixJ family two-component response regulator
LLYAGARNALMPLPLVVVVEDDPSSRTSLGRVLRAGGFDTALYTSAEEFLSSPPDPDPICLLLDIQLGGLSGLELQRRLMARGSRVPFIAITAFDDEHAREEAKELGCVAYLRKPCEGHTIVELIRSLR